MARSVAAFTMVHNESVMLPLWLAHYAREIGADHLHVLDHGSDTPVRLEQGHVEPVPRTTLDEIDRAALVADYQRHLLRHYDDVIFTDCDEFLVARPSLYTSLVDYAARRTTDIVRCVGADVLEHPNARPIDWSRPILRQRPYASLRSWSCKTLLSAEPLNWSPGFHQSTPPGTPDRDLWLFHLKYADLRYALDRLALTRALDWSDRARALRHGDSHRLPDSAMRAFFREAQGDYRLENLDIFLDQPRGSETPDTPLCPIPPEFLDAL